MVPEEHHLLLEGTLGVHHVVKPIRLPTRIMLRGHFGNRVEAVKKEFVQRRLGAGIEELFYYLLISLIRKVLKLSASGAKPGAPHEMGHKGNVFFFSRGQPPLSSNFPFQHNSELSILHITTRALILKESYTQ